jgi:hypothetical protein
MQFEGDDPTAAVAEFNEEINAERSVYVQDDALATGYTFKTPYNHLRDTLVVTDHLDTSVMPSEFRVVPDDAPELLHLLEELHHMIEERETELRHGWGAIVVSENQDGLRRMDLAIFWDGVEIDNGIVQLNEEGEPLPLGVSIRGEDVVFAANEDGTLYRDEDGAAVLVEDAGDGTYVAVNTDGDPIEGGMTFSNAVVVREQRLQTDHIFLHEEAAYFD